MHNNILQNQWQYYKAIVSYDGTHYYGWQSQSNKKTIQDTIERALEKIFRYKQKIIGASRTDAGVHAWGQVFTFYAPHIIELNKLQSIINNTLPENIIILELTKISTDFHPRFLAKKKVYQYLISQYKTPPSINFFIYHEPSPFSIDFLSQCLQIFIGTHDFRSFASEPKEKNTIKTIYDIKISKSNNIIIITFIGRGFLRYMIKRLVGAALYAAKKNRFSLLKDIFNQRNSFNNLPVMPSKGLLLKNVIYDETEIINYENAFLMPFINVN